MEKKKLSLSDFSWRSVGECIRILEMQCGLQDFRPEDVFAFKLDSSMDYTKLLNKKLRLIGIIEENSVKVDRFVEEHDLDCGMLELISVIRVNMDFALATLVEHALSCQRGILSSEAFSFLDDIDEDDACTDEAPF